jgi:IPT/TIG domain
MSESTGAAGEQETKAAPAETETPETKDTPAEVKPAEVKPAEVKPAEPEPPAEVKPAAEPEPPAEVEAAAGSGDRKGAGAQGTEERKGAEPEPPAEVKPSTPAVEEVPAPETPETKDAPEKPALVPPPVEVVEEKPAEVVEEKPEPPPPPLPPPPPVIAGTEPSCLSVKGGVLTILGADFVDGCRVHVGDRLVPVSWVHAGRVEAVLHNVPAGEADLVVENPDGQRVVRERAVRFAEPPVIAALVPAEAVTSGGAVVRVLGAAFEPGCAVLLAGAPLDGVVRESEGALEIVIPPHPIAEPVDVAVVNPNGLVYRIPHGFQYRKAPPHVDSITPASGTNAGGTLLTLRGRDFDPGSAAYICGFPAKVTFKSPVEIEVETPPVARDGLVDVRVVNADDQAHTLEKAFRYEAQLPPPVLREVSPAKGSQAGGLKVAVLGDDFAEGVVVRFGEAQAAVRFLTRKELEATTPSYPRAGHVSVEVVNPDGAAAVLDGGFTFEERPAPMITGISPTTGPTTGGTKVTIEGVNFTRDCQVYIGRENPRDQQVKSASVIQIMTPPHKAAGVVDVEVAAAGVPRAVMKNGFRYAETPAPVISSVSPNTGGVGGGTEMTILGKNFIKEAVVLVDGKPAKNVKLVDAKTLELKTPPGDGGKMADVIVRHPDGKEAVQKRAFLYDPRYR